MAGNENPQKRQQRVRREMGRAEEGLGLSMGRE